MSRGVVRGETKVELGRIQGASYTFRSLARSVVNSGVTWSDLSFRHCREQYLRNRPDLGDQRAGCDRVPKDGAAQSSNS